MSSARSRVVAGAVLTVLAVVASGCVTIPSAGPVQSTPPAPGGSGSACCRLIVKPPQRDWSPEQVVIGFLLASAQFAHGHAIAREYLTPAASRSWQPLSSVTILAQAPKVYRPRARLAGPNGVTTVVVTGRELATLHTNGQYIPSPQGDAAGTTRDFEVKLVNGQYLISSLPMPGPGKISHELLLTNDLFHLVYTPRDLYYAQPNETLVPNPVFVPAEDPNPAATLVRDLLHDPHGWLRGAVSTAFPPKARLRRVQLLSGSPGSKIAIVDIGLPIGVSQSTLDNVAAQVVVTLTSTAYSVPLFQAVKLKLNGHAWPDLVGGPVQRLTNYTRYIPHPRGNAVYYLTPEGAVRVLSRLASHGVPVRGEAGTSEIPLNKIAVSLDGRFLAGTAGPANTVYTCKLGSGLRPRDRANIGKLYTRLTGTSLTGLSWDRTGKLWVSGQVHHSAGVWVLPPAKGAAKRVFIPPSTGPVHDLRVAPDGVRVALIAGSSSHLLLGAIVRTGSGPAILRTVPLGPGLTHVSALSWFDTDHVMAVTTSGSVTHLWEVPVDGDGAASVVALSGMESITAAGPRNPLYLGLGTGRLEKSVGVNEPWTDVTDGRSATYPG